MASMVNETSGLKITLN